MGLLYFMWCLAGIRYCLKVSVLLGAPLEKVASRGGGNIWSVSVAVSGLLASLAPSQGCVRLTETQKLTAMLYLGSRGPYLLAFFSHLSESTYCLFHIMFRAFSCT